MARSEQAKALGLDLKDYEELIRIHKSGKYVVNFVKRTNKEQQQVPLQADNTQRSTIKATIS